MKSFVSKLDELFTEASNYIANKVCSIGKESKHINEKSIKIRTEEFNYNLDGDRYLDEITSDILLDNEGYHYDYGVLSLDQLCHLADYIKKRR